MGDQAGGLSSGGVRGHPHLPPAGERISPQAAIEAPLSPSYEPIVLARKPLQGTVAANVTKWGTGGINIDGCRIGMSDAGTPTTAGAPALVGDTPAAFGRGMAMGGNGSLGGRWPANVLLDEEAAARLDEEAGERRAGIVVTRNGNGQRIWGSANRRGPTPDSGYGDRGGPSRFFYTSKASRAERENGLHDLDPQRRSDGRRKDIENPRLRTNARKNHHPTVKPVDLMRWICRLVTPPGGLILDPFLGSGSTAIAAKEEGFRIVGIEREAEYLEIARRRCAQMGLMPGEVGS